MSNTGPVKIEDFIMALESKSDSDYFIVKNNKTYSIKTNDGITTSKLNYYDYSKESFDWILIADVETKKEYRGKGYASTLINEIYKDVTRRTPNKGIYLFVKSDNYGAIEFYKKNKFKFVKKYELKDGLYDIMCKGNADIHQFGNMKFR